ncbi:unnamed protein product [Cylindrotheca closterium]|uniref:Uncharacterized protein n=1 Tax=Cylindrotheca closterium TaxID=2856 RepID=A0AAD2G5K9_9STRA|nr:unnamed protein product [Cylindrotheca closterium]
MTSKIEQMILTCVVLLSLSAMISAEILENDSCIIGNDRGQFFSHSPGEIVTLNPPVCGFSACACNPTQENQLLCSFCYDSRLDDCLLNGESKTYPDQNLHCTCSSDSIDFSCMELAPPNKSPTQKPDIQIPAETPCVFEDAFGNNVLLDTSNVKGPCSGTKFPYVCNVERNLLLYPYCQHRTITGATICAKNDEYVVFINEQGDNTRCDCSIDSNTLQPSSDCYPQSDRTLAPSPAVPTQSSDATTIIPRLKSIGNIILVFGILGALWT